MSFFSWLFGTRQGVLALVIGAVVVFLIVALVLEHTGRKKYYNHEEPSADRLSDSESGWSDFDDDNN